MAIFSRRDLQRMLDSNRRVLSAEAMSQHIKSLNRSTPETISTEWEVAVLYGLSHIGKADYEPAEGFPGRLDVVFEGKSVDIDFRGDIFAVTDLGVDAENPKEAFFAEMARQARKMGLPSLAGFDVQIGRRSEGSGRRRKDFLALPPAGQIKNLLGKEYRDFLAQVRNEGSRHHSFEKREKGIDVAIRYRPGGDSVSAGYPGYAVPVSLTRNSLYNSLHGKAGQLKDAGATGTTILFACDGGSDSIRYKTGTGPHSYTRQQIVSEFFRNHSSVSAVCILTVERTSSPQSLVPFSGPPAVRVECLVNKGVSPQTQQRLGQLCEELLAVMPQPEAEVINAIHWLRSKKRKVGRSRYGGSMSTEREVRVSARAVQELLAGRISAEKFLTDHGWQAGSPGTVSPFDYALRTGRVIDGATVEKSPDRDDDVLVFHFSEEDPALAPFK